MQIFREQWAFYDVIQSVAEVNIITLVNFKVDWVSV